MAPALDPVTHTVDLATWTPIRVSLSGTTPMVEWCYTGDTQFSDPFFDQTIEWRLRRPFPLLFQQVMPIGETAELVAAAGPAEPAGFVFHASRCGSTLVSQMLAALPDVHMLSEPPPIDTTLRTRFTLPGVSDDQLVTWVRTIVLALARPGTRPVYKFDSWTTVDLRLIRQAFPDVPWIFVYREPAEIISSQMRVRGAHMIPGALPPGLFGMEIADALGLVPEDYCGRVLAAVLAAALAERERDPGRSLVVNYRRLPAAVLDEIAPLFGLACPDREAVLGVAGRDAKNPSLPFNPGSKAEPSPAEADAAARWALGLYEQLEALP
jgi:hypothetical protein